MLERPLEDHPRGDQSGGSGARGCVDGNSGEHTFAPQTRVGLADGKPGESEGVDDLRCNDAISVADREFERLTDIRVFSVDADVRLMLEDKDCRRRVTAGTARPNVAALAVRS